MKFVLLVYHGPNPALPGSDRWKALPEAEQKAIYADYAELNKAEGMTGGLPLGLPHAAKTVQVRDGKTHVREGTYLAEGAGGTRCTRRRAWTPPLHWRRESRRHDLVAPWRYAPPRSTFNRLRARMMARSGHLSAGSHAGGQPRGSRPYTCRYERTSSVGSGCGSTAILLERGAELRRSCLDCHLA